MCLLMILAVIIGLAIWQKTKKPLLGILAALIAWWVLRFLVAWMIVSALLRPDWEEGCSHKMCGF